MIAQQSAREIGLGMRVRTGINCLTKGSKCEHSGKSSVSFIKAGSFLTSWIILNF
jgi:hypothetical protein